MDNNNQQFKVDVLTLFPEMITNYTSESILGIASRAGLLNVRTFNPRDFANNKHKKVDDISYGGGAGMLLSPEPFYACVQDRLRDWGVDIDVYAAASKMQAITLKQDSLVPNSRVKSSVDEHSKAERNAVIGDSQASFIYPDDRDYEIIITSPAGRKLDQELVLELSKRKRLMIICGRYEGFDERIKRLATMEVSVGDFVLTGGELPALVMIDAISRYIPGVLGDASSLDFETHSGTDYYAELMKLEPTKAEIKEFLEQTGLNSLEDLRGLCLPEYPQYTKPADFRGMKVPEVLQSGNHKKIFMWRLAQQILRV